VKNAVAYDVVTAFRYEDRVENLHIWNSTIGRGVTRTFQAAGVTGPALDVRNVLVLGRLSAEASHPSNRSAGLQDFASVSANDYRLATGSVAIDAGTAIAAVATDRRGTRRPQGSGYDVGAYEWSSAGK
jgi:hypothetical protein